MTLDDFIRANPVIIILYILLQLALPTGLIALWLRGRNTRLDLEAKQKADRAEYERKQAETQQENKRKQDELKTQFEQARIDLEKMREQGEQESRRAQEAFELKLLENSTVFATEVRANREERVKQMELMGAITTAHQQMTQAYQQQSQDFATFRKDFVTEIDTLFTEANKIYEHLREAQHTDAELTQSIVGSIGEELGRRFDKLDPLLQLNDEMKELHAAVKHLREAQDAARTDILIELKQVNEKVLPLNEQLHNAGMKLTRLDDLAQKVQTAVERISTEMQRVISPNAEMVAAAIAQDVPLADEDTVELEITVQSPVASTPTPAPPAD